MSFVLNLGELRIRDATDVVPPVNPDDDGKFWKYDAGTDKTVLDTVTGGGVSLSDANTWSATQTFKDIGADLLVNGAFAGTLDPWVPSASNWMYSDGTALHTPGDSDELDQDIELDAGTYQIDFTVVGRTAGTVEVSTYSASDYLDVSDNGTYSYMFTHPGGTDTFYIWSADTDFDGAISVVSIRRIAENPAIVTYGDVTHHDLPTADPGGDGVWLNDGLMVVGDAPEFVRTDVDNTYTASQIFNSSVTFNNDASMTSLRDYDIGSGSVWLNSGFLSVGSAIPTDPTGLASGRIWSDPAADYVLKMVP